MSIHDAISVAEEDVETWVVVDLAKTHARLMRSD